MVSSPLPKISFSLVLSCIMLMTFLMGCGSDTGTAEWQSITRDQFTMTIDKRFAPADISSLINPSLRQSIIQAYSIPSPSSDFFEKNIIISREWWSPSLDLAQYANDVSNAIQQTWWWYTLDTLSDTSFVCWETEVPLFHHEFSLTRGDISSTWSQTLFFLQYIFESEKMLYIVSASTDDENDIAAFQWYMDSLACVDMLWTGEINQS